MHGQLYLELFLAVSRLVLNQMPYRLQQTPLVYLPGCEADTKLHTLNPLQKFCNINEFLTLCSGDENYVQSRARQDYFEVNVSSVLRNA